MKSFLKSPFVAYGLLGLGLILPLSMLKKYFGMKKPKKIKSSITIVADIGGTNSRFQLLEIDPTMEQPNVLFQKKYETQAFDTFESLFAKFLEECKASAPRFPNNAVIAMAGPVLNNKVVASNVKQWGELNGNFLKNHFNLESFLFLNDFEAIAYSVLKLSRHNFIQLNPGVHGLQNRKIGILGPGTGLGYCTMIPAPFKSGLRYYVWAGEGGHAAFSPVTEIHAQFMFWFRKMNNLGYLCTEKAFAGPGIKPIYRFFHETQNPELEYDENIDNIQIVQKGVKNEDPLCRKVVDFFLELYATELGNMACREKPMSGIYLVGSLTNAVKDYLLGEKLEQFLENVHNKDLMRPMVEAVPIYIVAEENLGLLGAFAEAQRHLI